MEYIVGLDAELVFTLVPDFDVLDNDDPNRAEDEGDCAIDLNGVVHRDGPVVDTTGVVSVSIGLSRAAGVEEGPGAVSDGAIVWDHVVARPRLRASRTVSSSSLARLRMTGGTDEKVRNRAAISLGGFSASWNTS